uniref:Pectinesterase inhibitor 10-like n=1 Tax=Elaeis guineensis var. tenera TaxID=51953 RepID=A0A6I9QBH8_ELAGV|nr:pectinesterase inhibitor 10-like [Elaeis guineensis]
METEDEPMRTIGASFSRPRIGLFTSSSICDLIPLPPPLPLDPLPLRLLLRRSGPLSTSSSSIRPPPLSVSTIRDILPPPPPPPFDPLRLLLHHPKHPPSVSSSSARLPPPLPPPPYGISSLRLLHLRSAPPPFTSSSIQIIKMASVEGSMPSMDDSSNTSSSQINVVRGKNDPTWNHCREAPELNGNIKRMKLAYLYCGNVFAGDGINRFKQYLTGVKEEAELCCKVPVDIHHQMIQNIQAIDILNLKDLDGDDGKNDRNDVNRREDGGDENIASQRDIFANIDINFSLLA